MDGKCQIGFEEYVCDNIESKSFGQKRMGIFCEGS
jgi:hypothetical protein